MSTRSVCFVEKLEKYEYFSVEICALSGAMLMGNLIRPSLSAIRF